MGSGTLTAIHVYPIKSCRAVALEAATVVEIGLLGDRTWQVVDGVGGEVNQRQQRVLATVQPELVSDGGLRIMAPSMPTIDVDPPGPQTTTVKSHFGGPVPASDAGDEAAAWFSKLTGDSVRLVAMVDACGWRLPGDLDVFGQNAPFSDAAPILMTAVRSLDWLRDRASEDFGMDRFRPNLVVSGTDPWEEDTWRSFTIGEAELRGVLPWPRSAIPQIDQVTAARHTEPARVLRHHRWCAEAPAFTGPFREILQGNGLFGIGCSIGPSGATVRIGDTVNVITTAPAVLPMA